MTTRLEKEMLLSQPYAEEAFTIINGSLFADIFGVAYKGCICDVF